MKQSIELAVTRIVENRMDELANVIQDYDERLNNLKDDPNDWETYNTLYNLRKGLIMAFNMIFDEPYHDYINR